MTFIPTIEYKLQVQLGQVPGWSIMRGLGEREGAGIGAEDVWRGNNLSPAGALLVPQPDTAGEQLSVVSEDVNDTAAGTGARTLCIDYLDAAGDQQQTLLTMNGTTPVDLTPSDVRFVQDMQTQTAGSLGVTAGNLKIFRTVDTTRIYSMIEAGGNQSLVPHKMVPRNHNLLMEMWTPAEAQGKRSAVRLRADCDNISPPNPQAGIFLFKSTVYLNGGAAGQIPLAYTIPEFCVVKASAFSDQVGTDVSVHWWGYLVDLDFA